MSFLDQFEGSTQKLTHPVKPHPSKKSQRPPTKKIEETTEQLTKQHDDKEKQTAAATPTPTATATAPRPMGMPGVGRGMGFGAFDVLSIKNSLKKSVKAEDAAPAPGVQEQEDSASKLKRVQTVPPKLDGPSPRPLPAMKSSPKVAPAPEPRNESAREGSEGMKQDGGFKERAEEMERRELKVKSEMEKVREDMEALKSQKANFESQIAHFDNEKLSFEKLKEEIEGQWKETKITLVKEKETFDSERKSFLLLMEDEKRSLKAERESLDAERKGLEAERKGFEAERKGFESDRKGFESERKGFEGFEVDKKGIESERKGLEAEKKAFEAEKKGFESEKKSFEVDKKGIESERKALEAEKKAFEAQKKGFESEKKGFEVDKKALESEKKGFESEKKALESEKKGFESERKAFEADKKGLESEKKNLEADKKAFEAHKQLSHLQVQETQSKLNNQSQMELNTKKTLESEIRALHEQKEILQKDINLLQATKANLEQSSPNLLVEPQQPQPPQPTPVEAPIEVPPSPPSPSPPAVTAQDASPSQDDLKEKVTKEHSVLARELELLEETLNKQNEEIDNQQTLFGSISEWLEGNYSGEMEGLVQARDDVLSLDQYCNSEPYKLHSNFDKLTETIQSIVHQEITSKQLSLEKDTPPVAPTSAQISSLTLDIEKVNDSVLKLTKTVDIINSEFVDVKEHIIDEFEHNQVTKKLAFSRFLEQVDILIFSLGQLPPSQPTHSDNTSPDISTPNQTSPSTSPDTSNTPNQTSTSPPADSKTPNQTDQQLPPLPSQQTEPTPKAQTPDTSKTNQTSFSSIFIDSPKPSTSKTSLSTLSDFLGSPKTTSLFDDDEEEEDFDFLKPAKQTPKTSFLQEEDIF